MNYLPASRLRDVEAAFATRMGPRLGQHSSDVDRKVIALTDQMTRLTTRTRTFWAVVQTAIDVRWMLGGAGRAQPR